VRKKTLAILGAVVVGVLLAPQGAFAVKPGSTCPPAFNLGGLTLEQALQLPNVQAGLAAGAYDEAALAAGFASVNANGDAIICFQTIPPSGATPNAASLWQFNYNIVDNNASVPSG
jgi:hypothetical protein